MTHSDFFCRVENGVITRVNVPAKQARKGVVNFPASADDEDFRGIGYWPQSGTKPTPGAGQIVTGPTYQAVPETQTVSLVYVARDKTADEIAADVIASTNAKSPKVIANATISINSGVLSGFTASSGLSGGFQISSGVYWIIFNEAQPDLNYSVNVNTSSGFPSTSSRGTGYFEVTVSDGTSAVNPAEMSIQIFRTN